MQLSSAMRGSQLSGCPALLCKAASQSFAEVADNVPHHVSYVIPLAHNTRHINIGDDHSKPRQAARFLAA
jgi:hypothetical protein